MEFEFHIQFQPFDRRKHEGLVLWKEIRKITFVWHPGEKHFKFDPNQSELDEEARANLLEWDSFHREWFLRFAQDRLATIATGPDERKREWLANWLKRMPDSPEKRSVEEALRR